MLSCDVTPSNSNDTASATGSAEAGHFPTGCTAGLEGDLIIIWDKAGTIGRHSSVYSVVERRVSSQRNV